MHAFTQDRLPNTRPKQRQKLNKNRRNMSKENERKSQEPRGKEPWILEALATVDKSCMSKLAKDAGVTAKGLKIALPRLIKERMVMPVGEQKGKECYSLTTYGLFSVFYYQAPNLIEIGETPIIRKEEAIPLWNSITDVAKFHGDKIPLVLGKWSYFKDKKIDSQILNQLKNFFINEGISSLLVWRAHVGYPIVTLFASSDAGKDSRKDWEEYVQQARGLSKFVIVSIEKGFIKIWSSEKFEEYEKMLTERLTQYVLFPTPTPLISDKNNSWLLVLSEDPDIKKYLKKEIAKRESHCQEEFSKLLQWKDYVAKNENDQ